MNLLVNPAQFAFMNLLVNSSQFAFIKDRSITYNITLVEGLIFILQRVASLVTFSKLASPKLLLWWTGTSFVTRVWSMDLVVYRFLRSWISFLLPRQKFLLMVFQIYTFHTNTIQKWCLPMRSILDLFMDLLRQLGKMCYWQYIDDLRLFLVNKIRDLR